MSLLQKRPDLSFKNCRIRILGDPAMDQPISPPVSPIRRQAADVLRRARKLPIGHDRNDLRQLAVGLLWLERKGPESIDRVATILALEEFRS
jgi:hypothetical protein